MGSTAHSEYDKLVTQNGLTNYHKFIPPVEKPSIPTSTEYKSGKYIRRFCINRVDKRIVEIDASQYDTLPDKKKGIDPFHWQKIIIPWKLKGPRFDDFQDGILIRKGVYHTNKGKVDKIAENWPSIASIITDYTLYATLEPDPIILKGDKIRGTDTTHKNQDNRNVFVIGFNSDNRQPNGKSFRKYKFATISGASKYNGTYETRPFWHFIDTKGRLGNLVLKGVRVGDLHQRITVRLS